MDMVGAPISGKMRPAQRKCLSSRGSHVPMWTLTDSEGRREGKEGEGEERGAPDEMQSGPPHTGTTDCLRAWDWLEESGRREDKSSIGLREADRGGKNNSDAQQFMIANAITAEKSQHQATKNTDHNEIPFGRRLGYHGGNGRAASEQHQLVLALVDELVQLLHRETRLALKWYINLHLHFLFLAPLRRTRLIFYILARIILISLLLNVVFSTRGFWAFPSLHKLCSV